MAKKNTFHCPFHKTNHYYDSKTGKECLARMNKFKKKDREFKERDQTFKELFVLLELYPDIKDRISSGEEIFTYEDSTKKLQETIKKLRKQYK